ncbi:hypothetical protein GCM10007216_28890 [Thalassobacillus devorans]|uniref:Arc-like DNA binding domain-containing protein n=1 Tax=Thalassobacillus devorans TaxID=279813 RepID=A0ABQ1PFN4_9BACI|nr:hypothetical protein [Thalassobacillus devorans]NIK29394.1 hypothetical protein [Thalassobacillus devorans]GGC96330.1 hypothetical protein GCM10007216_28890 [Thalassobacillus devorans]
MSNAGKGIQRGQSITFRIPSDTPDHLLKQLSKLKETERRNFSSKIAQFVLEGVNQSFSKDRETVTIPLPRQLTKEQRNWLKHEHSEALLGSIIHHLLADPVRATALLASMNSNHVNIDEALYLQEEVAATTVKAEEIPASEPEGQSEEQDQKDWSEMDKALDDLNFNEMKDQLKEQQVDGDEEEEESDEDPLGGFLSKMNN